METERIEEKSIPLNIMVTGDNIAEQYLQNIYISETHSLPFPETKCMKPFTLKQDETLKWTYEIFHNGLSKEDCTNIYKRIIEHNPKNNVKMQKI